MQLNFVIRHKEDLLKYIDSSQKLEIVNLKQMKQILEMNISSDIWENAQKLDLLSFNQQFIELTRTFKFSCKFTQYFYLISFLSNLTKLDLKFNKIFDISTIYKLKNLQNLDVSSNNIEDISAIQFLKDLTILDVSFNKIISYNIALPNLVDLKISCNKLQEQSGFQYSPKLMNLDISETKTTNIEVIPQQLFCLRALKLSFNNISDIAYISNFINLQSLHLDNNNELKNIEPLQACTQITELNMSNTSIADIWPLQFMKNLKTLDMFKTKVTDLHPLQFLHNLESISAFRASIIDVTPLSDLPKLNYLILNTNKIINNPLLHLNNYHKYDISDQMKPSADELKFYSKILKVHSSHKQIRTILNQNRIKKFKTQLFENKNVVETMFFNCIRKMNIQLEILAYFIQGSIAMKNE
ncbi:leucine-rich_repeat domain-containing protein [Hexamita inflata]|uniref:Leucine-rich repeat domain-containing protein n=1 Tax=Hexamita inflata TaxID=28002 RepID=A0AA86QXW9_9EUKA|nr:leucine-rich repeat domain-containing protein [Hexamita inflata]